MYIYIILIYIKLIDILYRWFFCNWKRKEIYGITVYYASFGVRFVRRSFLLSLRKSYKIQNSII